MLVARSTGRINLLGMHIDHGGGLVNPIAIKDAFFVVEPRQERLERLRRPEAMVASELGIGEVEEGDAVVGTGGC